MYDQKKISLVMPVLNEMDGLPLVLKSIPHCVDEIIVVDNGSSDGSVSSASRFGAKVIEEPRRGYGQAIIAGVMAAEGDIVVVSDADCTYPVGRLQEMLSFMCQGNFDFVSGNRFPLENKATMPLLNLLSNYCISWAVRTLFRIPICDVQSGFMFFRRSIFETIKVYSRGMGFSQEIKMRAWLSGKRCAEIHIPYYTRVGNAKFKKITDGLKNAWALMSFVREIKFSSVRRRLFQM